MNTFRGGPRSVGFQFCTGSHNFVCQEALPRCQGVKTFDLCTLLLGSVEVVTDELLR